MKKYVKSADQTDTQFNSQSFIQLLNDKGIDTTPHRYELHAQQYGGDNLYTQRFKCPGDYVAYFAMYLHESVKFDDVFEYFNNNVENLTNFINEHPDVEAMQEYAAYNWWGDGGDYVFYLKNLDTDEFLYQGDENEIEEDEAYDW